MKKSLLLFFVLIASSPFFALGKADSGDKTDVTKTEMTEKMPESAEIAEQNAENQDAAEKEKDTSTAEVEEIGRILGGAAKNMVETMKKIGREVDEKANVFEKSFKEAFNGE